jgi:hypothetical protein
MDTGRHIPHVPVGHGDQVFLMNLVKKMARPSLHYEAILVLTFSLVFQKMTYFYSVQRSMLVFLNNTSLTSKSTPA